MNDRPTTPAESAKTPVLYPNRCGICGEPVITDGTLHTWSGRMGLPERPYDHPAIAARTSFEQAGEQA